MYNLVTQKKSIILKITKYSFYHSKRKTCIKVNLFDKVIK